FFLKENIVALIVGEILYFSCSFILYWHTTSQSYALANFLFMLAVYFYSRSKDVDRKRFFLSGLFLGLSISVKLFYLPTAFLLWVIKLIKDLGRKDLGQFLFFSFGIVAGMLPFIIFLFIDWQRTVFGNIYYHLNRTDFSPVSESVRDLRIFSVLLGFKSTPKFAVHQAQILSWFLLLLGLFFILRDRKKLVTPLYLVSFFLFVSIFIPSPSYLKYFAISAPFIIILFSEELGSIFFKAKVSGGFFRQVGVYLLLFSVGVVWFTGVAKDFTKYTRSGEGVIGIGSKRNAPNWRVKVVDEVGRYTEVLLRKRGGKVLPYDWAGYFLGHDVAILQGYETRFSYVAALKLSLRERQRFKVKSFKDFRDEVKGGKAEVIVISPGKFSKELNHLLNSSGYRFRKRVRGILIFEKNRIVRVLD
ncbi:MAG: DUF2029 domain-containing protein, partial [Candidatus Dadabacteria bacterium]